MARRSELHSTSLGEMPSPSEPMARASWLLQASALRRAESCVAAGSLVTRENELSARNPRQSSRLVFTAGIAKIDPAVERTTFGEKGSADSSVNSTAAKSKACAERMRAVSYTHLTLPTILLV